LTASPLCPEAAAREALRIQRDPASCATVFKVWDEDGIDSTVDVTALDEERGGEK
jgi:hypothetical protein